MWKLSCHMKVYVLKDSVNAVESGLLWPAPRPPTLNTTLLHAYVRNTQWLLPFIMYRYMCVMGLHTIIDSAIVQRMGSLCEDLHSFGKVTQRTWWVSVTAYVTQGLNRATYTRMYVCGIHTCMHARTHTCTRTHAHTHTHTDTDTHTHTHDNRRTVQKCAGRYTV